MAASYIYEPLFSYIPASDEYLPRLALSYQESPDKRTLTVKLRSGVLWHDGHPFTSRDVQTTFLVGYLRNLDIWGYLDSLECPDDTTLRFHWRTLSPTNLGQALTEPITSPNHIFGHYAEAVQDLQKRHPRLPPPSGPGPLATPALPDKETLAAERDARQVLFSDRPQMPIGTGAFRMERVTASDMHLLRFEGYYLAEQVQISGVRLVRWGSNAVVWAYLFAGQVDAISPALPDDLAVEAMKRNPHLSRITPSDGSEVGLIFNCRRKPLSDVRVRRALATLIDRDMIRKLACHPADPPPDFSLGVVPSFAGRWLDSTSMAGLTPLVHDVGAAQAQLEALGWIRQGGRWVWPEADPNRPLEIMAQAGSTDQALVAEAIAAQLTSFGLPTEVRLLPGDLYGSMLADARFDLAATFGGQMGRYQHPSAPLSTFFYLGSPLQAASGLPEVREGVDTGALVRALRVEMDPQKTRQEVAKLAMIQHNSLAFVPCFEKRLNIFTQDGPRVTGWPRADSPLWSAAPLGVESLYALLAVQGLLRPAP